MRYFLRHIQVCHPHQVRFTTMDADNWRVVDGGGNMLGDRVLYHPHVDEQPFTRGLDDVKIPEGVDTVYIEAHDKVHGWTPKWLKVDLSQVLDDNRAKNGASTQ